MSPTPAAGQSDQAIGAEPEPGQTEPVPVDGLSILGNTVREAVAHVECFPAPRGCTGVTFSTDELTSVCPVTGQPDLSSAVIEYVPAQHCIESKSLKLFLWSFRDRAIFAEALAVAIADEVMTTAAPVWVKVTVTQRPRGGIQVETVSEFGTRPTAGTG